jgi:hypothetical protein
MRVRFPRLPHFPGIVATLCAAHATWVLERDDWSPEGAASRAGWDDIRLFDTYLWRNLGATLGGLRKRGGHIAVEERIVGWFAL